MKIIQLFSKTPNHKRFNYVPRHYDPLEDERKEREARIRSEILAGDLQKEQEAALVQEYSYRNRMPGSFKKAKKTATVQRDPSASMIRLISLLVLAVGLIGFLEFGNIALYAVACVFVPFYFYLKFRKLKQE